MEMHSEGIFLQPDLYTSLMNSIQRDCRVLESFKIMDYSLLIGIHNVDMAVREKEGGDNQVTEQPSSTTHQAISDAESSSTGNFLYSTNSFRGPGTNILTIFWYFLYSGLL